MPDIPSPFGGSAAEFDDAGAFVPEHLPDPGPFLDGCDVLTDERHVAFHGITQEVFEERTVYDMTFNYNLARLNRDTRHPNAGYRYAEESDTVLRAAFTPTTPFCPQTHTLTVGSFRAWNGLSERHGYDLVRVRADPSHHESEAINEMLTEMEETYRETGEIPEEAESDVGRVPDEAPF